MVAAGSHIPLQSIVRFLAVTISLVDYSVNGASLRSIKNTIIINDKTVFEPCGLSRPLRNLWTKMINTFSFVYSTKALSDRGGVGPHF